MKRTQPEDWPVDLCSVFDALGRAMCGRRLSPGILADFPTGVGEVLPGHSVEVRHVPKSVTGEKTGYYILTLDGDRWSATEWRFYSGELEHLVLARLGSSAAQPQADTPSGR